MSYLMANIMKAEIRMDVYSWIQLHHSWNMGRSLCVRCLVSQNQTISHLLQDFRRWTYEICRIEPPCLSP